MSNPPFGKVRLYCISTMTPRTVICSSATGASARTCEPLPGLEAGRVEAQVRLEQQQRPVQRRDALIQQQQSAGAGLGLQVGLQARLCSIFTDTQQLFEGTDGRRRVGLGLLSCGDNALGRMTRTRTQSGFRAARVLRYRCKNHKCIECWCQAGYSTSNLVSYVGQRGLASL